MIRIVLFDIDGTLVRTGGAGRRAFISTLEDVLARPVDHEGIAFAGRTDLAIFRSLLERNGVPHPDPEMRARVFDRYLFHLDRELAAGDVFRLCPGVRELLAGLSRDPEFLVGLLTGNIETGARRKLAQVGIDGAFSFGAFGSDDEERDRLVPIARARAARIAGPAAEEAAIVVVGDTPLDIRCARAGGARVLAVATGICDREDLASHAPDILLDDLSRTDEVLTLLRRLSDL